MANPHQCDQCGDDSSLYLHSRCHTSAPTWAVLTGDVLTLECARCQKVITRFRVAPEESSLPPVGQENLLNALEAAYLALRSYQYGNAATDLAKEIAENLKVVLVTAGCHPLDLDAPPKNTSEEKS